MTKISTTIDRSIIPSKVITAHLKGQSLAASWQAYKNLALSEIAKPLGVSESVAQGFVDSDDLLPEDMAKLAEALGVRLDQIAV